MKITNRSKGSYRKATLITTSAMLLGLCVPEVIAEEKIPKNFAIKTMVFNIWNIAEKSKIWKPGSGIENLTYSDTMRELLLGASPDILVLPELNNNAKADQVYDAFKQNTINVLNSAPRKQDSFVDFRKNEDTYNKGSPEHTNRDTDGKKLYYGGIGSVFSSVPFKDLPGDSIRINPGNGFPVGVVTGIHLSYSDSSNARVSAAQNFNKEAAASNVPIILLGDFNAGDVSERGLNRKTQQSLVFKKADNDNLHKTLAYEYMDGRGSKKFYKVAQTVQDYYGKEAKIHEMTWEEWGKALESAIKNNKDTGLQDETYPVNSNLPKTLNTFKRQYQLIQQDQNRELFQPSQVGDQRATWTSDGENQHNTWAGWDRATIDQIMGSRPFAKWIVIADDGKLSGNLSKQAKLPNNKDSLSDHEPVAQNLRWVGPQLEVYKDIADKKEKTRLVWGADAYNFAGRNKRFNLVRNNYRDDVYLGQVSDDAGNPILKWLTLPEKMKLLNCNGSKSKLQQAVDDYCIDDHSFIGETLVKDGGLLVVDEDKALGGSKAKLRLANGGLMVAGLSMLELNRDIVLEQQGWIDIAESDLVVSAKKAVTGTGSLTKLGAGTLALSGPNSYTGGTLVEEGILRADTGVGFVNNTAYSINGGALDLNGFDLIASKLEGKGGAVRLGTGSLTLDQSVNTRYDGSIEGSGGLTKSGSGGLILNGQNSYTGATLVRDGHLVIGDSDHPDARLESPVTVSPGATLGGIGTLGALTINAGGRIAPGNSIGTLHTGDVTFDAGSVYSVEVGPNGRSDLIDSAGVATLNGGEVRVSLENRTNLLAEDEAKTLVGQTFNILRAKKGIVGQFASITPNYLFLDSQISAPRTQQLLNGPPVSAAPPAASAIPGATAPPVADAQIVAAPAPAEPGAPETTVPPVADAQIVAAPAPAEPGAPETTVPPVADAQIVAAPAPAEPGAPETTVPPVADAQIVAAPAPTEPVTPKASVDVAIAPAPVPSPVGVAPVQPVPDMTAMSIAIKRNNTSFASVAQTKNERAVAAVADTLALGNPVYESLLTFNSAEQARQAFKQLDGQVHADAAAAQIADSRYVRDAVNARLQQAQALNPDAKIQVDSTNGGWVQLLGGHTQLDSDHNATSYSTSTTGVLLGLDTDIGDGWRIGGATGYTKTDLKGASRKSANSDNYHLSIYGGKRFDSIALRFGGASTWHHFDTSRNVGYGNQSAHQKAVYNARTDQVFGEVGYTGWSAFEPFANLTYINFQSDAFKERGKATALHASKQSQDAIVSTVGLRGQMQLPVSSTRSVKLRGELGWEHQYAELDRESSLKFVGSDAAFAVNSVPVSRDGAVVKASAEMAMTKDTQISLNYTGLVSSHGGGSAVNLGFTFQF